MLASWVSSHQITIHDPAVFLARFRANPFDIADYILEFSGHQNLVRRADISTPVNVDILISETFVGAFSIQHHNHAVDVVRKTLGYAPPRCYLDRLSNAIQRYLVLCGQSLDAAYPRDHFKHEI